MIYHSKSDIAVQALKQAVLTGRYAPGDWLRQNDVARDLGLSSTPVREALRELHVEGILEYEPHRGMRVPEINLCKLERLYSVRALLEGHAAGLAAIRITDADLALLEQEQRLMLTQLDEGRLIELIAGDEALHLQIYAIADNEYLLKAIKLLWQQFPRYLLWSIPERARTSVDEHPQLIHALATRDAAVAELSCRLHLESALAALRTRLDANRETG